MDGGTIPTLWQVSESEEKHLRLRVKQLVCGSLKWNENQTVLAAAIRTPDRDSGPLGDTVGSWSLGIVEQPKGEDCC